MNLKKGTETVGAFEYDKILPKLREELDKIIEEKFGAAETSAK